MPARKKSAKRGSTQAKPKKPSVEPSGAGEQRKGVPQPHGGMLVPGAGGGPQPGSGRPRSAIRKDLLGSFDDRRQFLDQVIDGDCVTHHQVPLASVIPHVKCETCGDKARILPRDIEDLFLVQFDAKASASVGDRLRAMDTQAKYALGALKGILADQVEENVKKSLDAIRELVSPEVYAAISARLRPIWA